MNRKAKALEFAQEGYNIAITGRHLGITDSMKDYAMEKISKIERFTDRLIDVIVTMDIQKLQHRVDIVLKNGYLKIKASAASESMYISIDRAVDKIIEQIRRYKTKIQDHHAKGLPFVDMTANVLRPFDEEELLDVNEEIEDETLRQLEEKYTPHHIVQQEKSPLKTLTSEEALLKMELSGDPFLLFLDEIDRQLKVIYRRKDSNYGIIEPLFLS